MKKLTKLCLSFFIVILTINFLFIKINATPSIPIAKKGVLDLSNWDFEKALPIELNGEWEYYESILLSPYDLANSNIDISYKSLVKSEGLDILTTKRNVFYEKKPSTYRLRVVVKDKDEILGINTFNTILGTSKLWIDNELVWENNGNKYFQKDIFFKPNDHEFYITLQVNNIVRSLFLGSQQNILKKSYGNISTSDTIIFIIFVIALYHFIIYLFRRKNKIPLYFAIMSIAGSVYQICANSDLKGSEYGLTYALFYLMSSIDFSIRKIIWSGSVVLLCVGVKLFLTEIFKKIIPPKIIKVFSMITKVFVAYSFTQNLRQ